MMGTWHLLQIVLPVFLIVGAGYAMRQKKILTEQADQSLLGITINLFVPCLALDVIIGNAALSQPINCFLPPVIGFLSVAVGMGLSWLVAKFFLKGDVVQRTFACTAGLQNYGYIPLPLCQALFGREVVGVLFAFNLGVEVAMWSVVVAIISGRRASRCSWKTFWSPPLLSVLAALLLNLVGAEKWIPAPVDTAWHMLGLCAVPLGLLLSGALLADCAGWHLLRSGWKSIGLAIGLRVGIIPVLLLISAAFLSTSAALRSVLIVQAAMPSALFPIVLAKMYNGDIPTAVRVVIGTSLVGLVTIPLWLALGMRVFL